MRFSNYLSSPCSVLTDILVDVTEIGCSMVKPDKEHSMSLTKKGVVNLLNLNLVKASEHVIDYVVLH